MDKNKKILSIIIPTYNMEKYLRKCLDSLCLSSDNFSQLEVLVVNDGSKDSSSSIAHEYEAKYADVFRVIDKENGNYGSCVNRGLQEATGKYIKVLDADDSFDKTSLSVFIDFLVSHDADLFLTDFQQVHDDGVVVLQKRCHLPENQELRLLDYYRFDDFKYLQMHSITYRRQNLINLGYKQTEGISYTDAQWVFLPMSSVITFYYCPVMLYHYLVGRLGQTMAADIYAKSLVQLMKMTIGRINMYEQYQLEQSDYKLYFISKLSETVKFIYRYALVVDTHFLEDLRRFDYEIKEASPSYYEYSEGIVLFEKIPFRMIKYWRKSGRNNLPYIYQKVFKLLYKLSAHKL